MSVESLPQPADEPPPTPTMWGVFAMATREGTVVDVSGDALPSILEGFGYKDQMASFRTNTPTAPPRHVVAAIRVLAACKGPKRLAQWASAFPVSLIASQPEALVKQESTKDVSDEEYLLDLWDAIATFLAEARSAQPNRPIGLVVGLAAAQHWRFLKRRLSAVVCGDGERPCGVSMVLLVPTGPQKTLAGLQPLLVWEREMHTATRSLRGRHAEGTVAATSLVLQVKTSKLIALGSDDDATEVHAVDGPNTPIRPIRPTHDDVTSPIATPMRHDGTSSDVPLSSPSSPSGVCSAGVWTGALMTPEHLSSIAATVEGAPSRVVLISGPTGCGKSTKVPMALADAAPSHVVWIAQPRRVAAVSLCRRIHVERGNALDAAYVIGGSRSEQSTATARMVFMTSGVMLQRVKGAFRTGMYLKDCNVTHIVLDEVHERTVEYDLLLCMLRELLKHHTQLRLILTSATMSAHSLQGYMHRGWLDQRTAWPPSPSSVPMGAAGGTHNVGEGVCEGPNAFRSMYGNFSSLLEDDASDGANTAPPLHDAQAAANLAVPVVTIPSTSRRRKTHYIEDAIHHMTTTIASAADAPALRSAGGGLSPSPVEAGRWEHVFHDPTVVAREEAAARDALSSMRLPFNVRDVLMKPLHRDSLVWEARFRLAVSLVRFLHISRPAEEAILIFLSGIHQLEALRTELEQLFAPPMAMASNGSNGSSLRVHLLHSTNDAENHSIFESPPAGVRKVLIATNIAESSLTIPDVDHVIDACVVKDQRFVHDEGLSMLEEVYCSKDSCEQRAGRTGRVRPGTVWRLVTKAEYEQFDEGRTPGILQTPLTTTMLLASDANVGEMDRFVAALPTPPPLRGVLIALRELTDHYGALMLCQARGNALGSLLQPTCKGLVMGTLGVSVPIGQLVVLGVACGITSVVVQAAAILSTTAPLLCDDTNVRLADFDHGTGCDVVACMELYRWCMRQRAPFARDPTTAPLVDSIVHGVRTNVLHEVGAKSRDLLGALAQYGLAQPVTSSSGGRGHVPPKAADDVDPLTPEELLFFIAVMTMAFPNRTAAGNDLSARYRSHRGRTNGGGRSDVLFTPAHRVCLVQRSPVTHSDEERIQRFLEPATCTTRRVGESKLTVDIDIERRLDAYGELVDDRAFHVRNVRNIAYDAYRLIKTTRSERRDLNIAYADAEDDVHLLSSWFVPCKPALFVDRASVLYPLVFDITVAQPPTVVSCNAVRRENRVALLSNLLLPGSLSVLPLALAPVPHWDGRSQDSHQCLTMPTLPHCHPSIKHLKRTAECLLDDVVALNSVVRTFYNEVLDYCSRQEYLSAADGCARDGNAGGAWDALAATYLEPAYEAVQHKAAGVQRALGRVLCIYLKDVPPYYCPAHVAAFIDSCSAHLPSYLMSQPYVSYAVAAARRPKASRIHRMDDASRTSLSTADAAHHRTSLADAVADIPLPSVQQCQSIQHIVAPTHRGVLRLGQIAKYLHHILQRHASMAAASPSPLELATVYGIVPRRHAGGPAIGMQPTDHEQAGSPTAGPAATTTSSELPEWMQRLAFPRPYAKSIPMDATCAAIAADALRVLQPMEPQRQWHATPPITPTPSWAVVDAAADDSCGALLLHMVVRAVQCMRVRTAILCSRQEWTRGMLATNVHTVLRHLYPTAGSLCQWCVVLDDTAGGGGSGTSTVLPRLCDASTRVHEDVNTGSEPAGSVGPTEAVHLMYIPPQHVVAAPMPAPNNDAAGGEAALLPHEHRIVATTLRRMQQRQRACHDVPGDAAHTHTLGAAAADTTVIRSHLLMVVPSDRSEACCSAVAAMLSVQYREGRVHTTAMTLVGSYDDAVLQVPRLQLWHGTVGK